MGGSSGWPSKLDDEAPVVFRLMWLSSDGDYSELMVLVFCSFEDEPW